MKVPVPDYLLESVIRHYEVLSSIPAPYTNLKAVNAKRVSSSEIRRLKKILSENKPKKK